MPGLSRAGLLAAGIMTGAATAACGDDALPEKTTDAAIMDTTPTPVPQPIYGAPPPREDASVDAKSDATPTPIPQPVYGAPPPR